MSTWTRITQFKVPLIPRSIPAMSNLQPHFAASTDSLEESLLPSKDTEAEIIFTPLLQPEKLHIGGSPARLGGADLGPPGHFAENPEEEGMIMGPSHPIFHREREQHPDPHNPRNPFNPELPVPPGARFDPISPVGPSFYSPGDPDFDDLPPPGGPPDVGIRPPRGPKLPGSKRFPSAPFGHPHGAPPGAGNPPFFM